jgi:hypothetical protein
VCLLISTEGTLKLQAMGIDNKIFATVKDHTCFALITRKTNEQALSVVIIILYRDELSF